VVMPEMGGGQLVERLRTLRPGIRVLYTSGYADSALVAHGVAVEGIPFLPKPFVPAALVAKVREVLETAENR
jgi:two-component system, cell cycle sensor histidine kinase and response regulator CckA